MIRQILRDTIEMTKVSSGRMTPRALLSTFLLDSYAVVVMNCVREAARRWHVPAINRALRLLQMTIYSIEIGKDVELGDGIYLVHTMGTVIGGDARIGARVRMFGNNTIGTAKDNGYPTIEEDVLIGAGARILGPVRIGAGARIGANAVVLTDVPKGAVATGIPAVVRVSNAGPNEGKVPRPMDGKRPRPDTIS